MKGSNYKLLLLILYQSFIYIRGHRGDRNKSELYS
jgi:hypothetical protein